jgi:hypothetical protein
LPQIPEYWAAARGRLRYGLEKMGIATSWKTQSRKHEKRKTQNKEKCLKPPLISDAHSPNAKTYYSLQEIVKEPGFVYLAEQGAKGPSSADRLPPVFTAAGGTPERVVQSRRVVEILHHMSPSRTAFGDRVR